MDLYEKTGLSREEDDYLRRLDFLGRTVELSRWHRQRIAELRKRDRRRLVRPPRDFAPEDPRGSVDGDSTGVHPGDAYDRLAAMALRNADGTELSPPPDLTVEQVESVRQADPGPLPVQSAGEALQRVQERVRRYFRKSRT